MPGNWLRTVKKRQPRQATPSRKQRAPPPPQTQCIDPGSSSVSFGPTRCDGLIHTYPRTGEVRDPGFSGVGGAPSVLSQNLPFSFFHSERGGTSLVVSQCSTTLPLATLNRS
jgi:hypothetical protein